MASERILFLTLRVFSATGGIEKVCRAVAYAFAQWQQENPSTRSIQVFSMYDTAAQIDPRYLPSSHFTGFGLQRIRFILAAVWHGWRADHVVLSHINLLLVVPLIRLFAPRKSITLIAHGIEVWRALPSWKVFWLRRLTRVLCVSMFTQEQVIRQHGVARNRLKVVWNGLDPFLLPPASPEQGQAFRDQWGIPRTANVMMTLTRISSTEGYKGYDQLIQLISAWTNKYPNFYYVLVGKYDQVEKDRLDQLITSLGVSDRVLFTGFLPDSDVPACFAASDVYVMPSKKEGFGLVFIEALYYGKSVVAGSKDGSVDALLGGKLGKLVDPDNKEAVFTGVCDAMETPIDRQVQAALVEQHFSFRAYADRFIQAVIT